MDPQSLSDDHLEKLVCTNCLQYLSYSPVTVNRNGEMFCGRCKFNKSNLNVLHSKYTIFNIVAKQFLFKCINHFEGCTKLLKVEDTDAHEKNCQYKDHECFFCFFTGNWSQIAYHCKREHPENFTNDGLFQFEVGSEFLKKLVYVVKSNIFLLTIKITKEKLSILISPEATTDFIVNQFAVKCFPSSDPYRTNIYSVDYSLFDVKCVNLFEKYGEELVSDFGRKTNVCCQIILRQIALSEKELESEKKWLEIKSREMKLNKQEIALNSKKLIFQEQEKSLDRYSKLLKGMAPYFTCINCQKLPSKAVYLCPQNHVYCETCVTDTCKSCKQHCESTGILECSKVSVSCDWPGCRIVVGLPEYLVHRCKCPLRPYKCPIKYCLEVIYSSEKLKNHWHVQTPPLVTQKVIKCNKYGNYEYYWMLNTELYIVMISFLRTDLQITIDKVNVLSGKIQFKTLGFWDATNYDLLNSVDFFGKYQVISSNRNRNNNGYYTMIEISTSRTNK